MPEGLRKQESEPIHVETIKDNGPEDFDGSKRGYQIFIDLINKLREQNPDKNYIGGYEYIDPENPDNQGENRDHFTTLVARNTTEVTGVFIGEQEGTTFKCHWFVIDPRYQNGQTSPEIFKALDQQYNETKLMALAFGNKKDSTKEERQSRQEALIRYYKRLGFQENKDVRPYEKYKNKGDMMPMIRVRNHSSDYPS